MAVGERYTPDERKLILEWAGAPSKDRCSLRELARRLGRNPGTLKNTIRLERLRDREGPAPRAGMVDKRIDRGASRREDEAIDEMTAAAIRRRDEFDRLLRCAPLTFGQQFFGDPLPTRSALERRGQEVRA